MLRQVILNQSRQRLADPIMQERNLALSRQRYNNPVTGEEILERSRARSSDPRKGAENRQAALRRYHRDKEASNDVDYAIGKFREACKDYPCHVCVVYRCFRFKSQTMRLNMAQYNEQGEEFINQAREYEPAMTGRNGQQYMSEVSQYH